MPIISGQGDDSANGYGEFTTPYYGSSLYTFPTGSYVTFNGTSGYTGPSLSTAISTLSSNVSTSWSSNTLYFNTSGGIQLWTVPSTGTFTILAAGAAGGTASSVGGRGLIWSGNFSLVSGTILYILVGQLGVSSGYGGPPGGGGGTFVLQGSGTSTPLIISGGGGGGANTIYGGSVSYDAVSTNTGVTPLGTGSQISGGTGGTGGNGATGGGNGSGGGNNGGGLLSSGTGGGGYTAGGGTNLNGFGYAQGGSGGFSTSPSTQSYGGFGGGASGYVNGFAGFGGGGAGGYSGGGGAGTNGNGGGGGGSYNAGSSQSGVSYNAANGYCTITKVS